MHRVLTGANSIKGLGSTAPIHGIDACCRVLELNAEYPPQYQRRANTQDPSGR